MTRIRPGTADDHEAALEVYRRARTPPPTPERLARVRAKLASELLVVADDDGVIGFGLGEPDRSDATVLHVSMIFVEPSRQRGGVGTALVEGLADLGWAAGHRSISLWSSSPAFYEACGLEPTGETQVLADGRTAVRFTAELEAPVPEIMITGAGIRLGQLLKFAGLADTGADAKALLTAEAVQVNGEVETRRGRQLRDGDEVRANDAAVVLRLPEG